MTQIWRQYPPPCPPPITGEGRMLGRSPHPFQRPNATATMNDPPRILVVDDSEANRDIIVTRLRAHGYATAEAADGEQGLAAVSAWAPDLILLDVAMPKLDGIEVCRRLKDDGNR